MDWKAVDPTESNEVNEVIELLDVSFPVDRDYIERAVVRILSDPGKEGQLYRLRSISDFGEASEANGSLAHMGSLAETQRTSPKSADGDLIATVTYGPVYGDGWDGETFVRFFAVHPDYRRQGYAAWIIKKIMNDAQACGSRCVALSSLQSDKIAAGIWERRGFTVYATQPCEEYPENGNHDCYVYWFSE